LQWLEEGRCLASDTLAYQSNVHVFEMAFIHMHHKGGMCFESGGRCAEGCSLPISPLATTSSFTSTSPSFITYSEVPIAPYCHTAVKNNYNQPKICHNVLPEQSPHPSDPGKARHHPLLAAKGLRLHTLSSHGYAQTALLEIACISLTRLAGSAAFTGLGIYSYASGMSQLRQREMEILKSGSMFGMGPRRGAIMALSATLVGMGFYRFKY